MEFTFLFKCYNICFSIKHDVINKNRGHLYREYVQTKRMRHIWNYYCYECEGGYNIKETDDL